MKHPPYHLRPNKFVDRFLLLEALRRLQRLFDPERSLYVGLGGPFLEDFRLVSSAFPSMRMICLERNYQTHLRQRFHRTSRLIELRNEDATSFVKASFPENQPVIMWLDYTDLRYAHFDDFMNVLQRCAEMSIVRITLQADPKSWLPPVPKSEQDRWNEMLAERIDKFNQTFGKLLERPVKDDEDFINNFPLLVQGMVSHAANIGIPKRLGKAFQVLSSTHYSDNNTTMLTITGIVCQNDQVPTVRRLMRGWKYFNGDWAPPSRIDVPDLSQKERLALERYLPSATRTGKRLQQYLGYKIDDSESESLRKCQQLAEFWPLFPQFARIQ